MSSELLNPNQCSHINAAGRRCRMPLAPTHDSLCTRHLQQHRAAQPDPETLAAELLDSTGNLNTADRVNALLANTVKQLARQRLDRRDALAIGYLAQMLLSTVPGVQKEYQAIRASQARRQAVRNSRNQFRPHPLPSAPSPAPQPVPAQPDPRPAPAPQPANVHKKPNLAAPPVVLPAAPVALPLSGAEGSNMEASRLEGSAAATIPRDVQPDALDELC